MKLSYWFAFLLFTGTLAAEDVLEVRDDAQSYNLSRYTLFYEDPSGSLTINDILKPEIQNRFLPNPDKIPDFGLTSSAIWGKFTYKLPSPNSEKKPWYVMFSINMDRVDFYSMENNGSFTVQSGGEDIPYNERPIEFNQLLFKIHPDQNTRTIYYRVISNHDKVILNPVVLSPLGLVKFSAKDKSIHALYLGIILSMIIYNGFIFLTFKDNSYAYYILYLVFTGFGLLLGFNFFNGAFFPDTGGLFFPISYFMVIGGFFFSIQFLRSFLYTSINLPDVDNILKGISISLPGLYIIYFISLKIFINLFYIFALVVPLLMIYTGIKLYSKYIYAKIYTNAWVVYLLSIIIYSLQFFSFIPFISFYILEIGQALEATILSIALSYKMKELHYRANRDFLTGLFNRSSFQEHLTRQLAIVNINGKKQRDLSLILFDIDNFKKINDDFGHGVGDRVLQTLARVIPEHLRVQDLFCRWGGEEFVIIIPETSLKNSRTIAEKLRVLIESHRFPVVENITASFGVASYIPPESIRSFFQRADKALYIAKTTGKNKVEILEGNLSDLKTAPVLGEKINT